MGERPLSDAGEVGATLEQSQSGAERLRLDSGADNRGRGHAADFHNHELDDSVPRNRSLSDEELAERFFAGDERAARDLVERFHRQLYGMLVRLTRSPAEAEELFQESFLRAFAAGNRFDRTRRFKPWLFAIAVNLARDRGKRQSHPATPQSRDPRELPERGRAPEDDWIRRADMAEALSHLPQAHRDVLVLRYFQGLTEAEIASELGIPKGTVKSRVHHALRKLRDALQGDAT